MEGDTFAHGGDESPKPLDMAGPTGSGASSPAPSPSQSISSPGTSRMSSMSSGRRMLPPMSTRLLPRTDPADLPAAGKPMNWSSANDDYRRTRVVQEADPIKHTNIVWYKGDPTRKEKYPPPTPPVDHFETNKPDFQLDVSDVEGARPRSRPHLDHHRTITSPTSRSTNLEGLRFTNPLAPYYPWATDVSPRAFPTQDSFPAIANFPETHKRLTKVRSGDMSLRWSTGTITNDDIDGARTIPRYERQTPLDPQTVSDIPGTSTKQRHPSTQPNNSRPEIHTRSLGRWCYGDSGLFTQFPREAPVDPLGPDYHYDPRAKTFRMELENFARERKSVPRVWDPLKNSPGELVGKMEAMGTHRTARTRASVAHVNATSRMVTSRPDRTFDFTSSGRSFS